MRSPLFAIPLLLSLAVQARTQLAPELRSFEPSITPWIGSTFYDKRLSAPNRKAGYRNSPTVGLRADFPITRRIGLIGGVSVSPMSKQLEESSFGSSFVENVTAYRAEAGLGWRFKPTAPVFFYGGGGVFGATKYALPGTSGSVLEPMAAFGLGYDRASKGRWSFRAALTTYLVFPSAPDPPSDSPDLKIEAASVAQDWALQIGGRYMLSRRE